MTRLTQNERNQLKSFVNKILRQYQVRLWGLKHNKFAHNVKDKEYKEIIIRLHNFDFDDSIMKDIQFIISHLDKHIAKIQKQIKKIINDSYNKQYKVLLKELTIAKGLRNTLAKHIRIMDPNT